MIRDRTVSDKSDRSDGSDRADRRGPPALLYAVLVLALALRVGMGLFLGLDSPPDQDACGAATVEVDRLAWSAAQGKPMSIYPRGEPTAFRAPGYPFLLAGLYRVFGHAYRAGRIALSLLGVATCLLVYVLGRRIGLQRDAALIAALVTAVLPSQFYWSVHLMSETLAAFLNVAACLALVRTVGGCRSEYEARSVPAGTEACAPPGRDRGLTVRGRASPGVAFLLTGLLCGLAALTRAASLLFPVVVVGLWLVSSRMRPRRVVLAGAALLAGTVLAILPWTVRNAYAFDRFALISTNGGSTFWGANNEIVAVPGKHWGGWVTTNAHRERKRREVLPLGNEVDRDRAEWRIGLEYLYRNPGRIPMLVAGKLVRLMAPFPDSPNRVYRLAIGSSWLLLLALALPGMVLLWRRPDTRRRVVLLHLELMVLLATTVVFYGSARFRMPYEPFLAVFAGAAAAGLAGKVRQVRGAPAAMPDAFAEGSPSGPE